MVPMLLIMMMCFKDGIVGEDCDKDKLGTRCFINGICDRV